MKNNINYMLALDASQNLNRSGRVQTLLDTMNTCAITWESRPDAKEITDLTTVISLPNRVAVVANSLLIYN